jgi:diaminobutyrate-2-oxoglutarate transaminase
MSIFYEIIEHYESTVRSYSRRWPVVWDKAEGSYIYDEDGRGYLDFFSGAGGLNYGHNDPDMVTAMLNYIKKHGIIHGLDMATVARAEFIKTFVKNILEPRKLDYRIQFTNPSGANAVEAALKLARNYTERSEIVALKYGYHGLSLGSLAATYNPFFREAAGIPLGHTEFLPFNDEKSFEAIVNMTGTKKPAAVIVEAIQGEGGVNVVDKEWLRKLRQVTKDNGILLIVDDIQAGCGRSGDFFAFEESGIVPDIVTLSKSISGIGLPMAIVLSNTEIDKAWKPAQHTGTFRGNNLAFIAATVAINKFWQDDKFSIDVKRKGKLIQEYLTRIANQRRDLDLIVKGRGMFNGLGFSDPLLDDEVAKYAFEHQLIIECSGPYDEVLKFLPALTISDEDLLKGLQVVEEGVMRL